MSLFKPNPNPLLDPVQCKLCVAMLNSTLPYSLANPGPTRQQTQLVRCYS